MDATAKLFREESEDILEEEAERLYELENQELVSCETVSPRNV